MLHDRLILLFPQMNFFVVLKTQLKTHFMKKTLVSAVLILMATFTMAQGVSPYSLRNLRFGFELNNDIWLNKPDDLKLKTLNRGVNLSLLYHNRFGESNFGIASGVVLASQNMYMKNAVLQVNDQGVSEFNTLIDTIPHQKNKLNLTFIEVPIEFSYKTKSHLTFALGAKAGYLIADKTKYNGRNYMSDAGTDIKMKFHDNDNILNYRLGAYAVIGYKWVNLTAYYGLTNLFEDNLGPEMTPLTIGILVRPY
jgi:hypothetical protein